MFERFTDASRRVVVYAQEESRGRRDGYIGSADATTRRLLDGLGVDSERLDVRLRALPGTAQILGPAARTAASGQAGPAVAAGRLAAALHTCGRHLDGCRADEGCTRRLDALLHEFAQPATTAAVPT